MVLINKAINEVTVKLVYYGPGLCGKTTNLEKIYGNPKLENKGKMISMSTETDRTLFFDFMPMELGTIAGQKVRVQLYTVPGQVFYDATRKLVLRGADGVVFVADSQNTMRESNLESLENLLTNLRLNRIDPDKVGLVYQYNKRDLPNVDTVDAMNAYMKPGHVPVVEASAINGIGVTATLRTAVARILDNLKHNVDTVLHDAPPLAPPIPSRTPPPPPPPPAPPSAPLVEQAPFTSALEPEPSFDAAIETAVDAVAEDDPFGAVAVADFEPEPEPKLSFDNPFAEPAAETHDADAERGELAERGEMEEMLANARGLEAALEAALERARENVRILAARLARST
jgi:signal recognition particle receptor subunit beta